MRSQNGFECRNGPSKKTSESTPEVTRKFNAKIPRGMDLLGAVEQRILVLDVLRVGHAALDRAYRVARLLVVESNALRAEVGVDHVDLVALGDCIVRAFRLTSSTVDALFGDVGGHLVSFLIFSV